MSFRFAAPSRHAHRSTTPSVAYFGRISALHRTDPRARFTVSATGRPRRGVGVFLRYEFAAEIQPAIPRLGFDPGLVILLLAGPEEVHDMLPTGVQKLCDQASVAAPPECFRAHEARHRLRQRHSERRLPPLGAHAGGIATKRGDAQALKALFAGLSGEAAPELARVPIGDPASLEHRLDRRL